MTVLVLGSVFALRVLHLRLAAHRADRTRRDAIPDLVDLFAIAAAAGHPPWTCVMLVAERAPEACRGPMRRAARQLVRGVSLDDALLAMVAELGPDVVPLVDALRGAAASGGSLVGVLERVVGSARVTRRRSAERRARRLPVELIFPLVCCILPAFLLLAVVPVVFSAKALGFR